MKPHNLLIQPETVREGSSHTLHLYTPRVDKYTIQRAFLSSNKDDEKTVYVTADAPDSLLPEFATANSELEIMSPEEIKGFESEGNHKLRVVIDAGSLHHQKEAEIEQRENYLNQLIGRQRINCLCTYDVTRLEPKTIKKLAMYHSDLQLTTSDLTILSGHLFDRSRLSERSIEKMVKDNLETIILALLQKKPMCGTEITGTIHVKFNVLLSPGTIYPLLQSLKEKGLVKSKKQGKAKTYTLAKESESKIQQMIDEHIQARNLLNHYLQRELTITEVH